MRQIVRFMKAFDQYLETTLSIGLYVFIIEIVFLEVVARHVFSSSILWAEETSIYAFIWLTYISMASLARSRSHLAFTAIRDVMPPTTQLILLLISDVCLLALSIIIIVYVYQPMADNIIFNQQMMGVNLPLWMATAAVPFGWFLVVIRVVQRAGETIRRYKASEPLDSGIVALD